MRIKGTIVQVDTPEVEKRFSRYLVIETEKGELGVQVRGNERRKYFKYLQQDTHIEADVHFEHSIRVNERKNGRKTYFNNIILERVIE